MREAGLHAGGFGIRAGAALFGQLHRGRVGSGADVLEQLEVPRLGHGALERRIHLLQQGVHAHQAETDRSFLDGRIDGAVHLCRRAVDEVLQHIVEEAVDVLDEIGIVLPIHVFRCIERRQAADRGALLAVLVEPGRQHDLGAQIGLADLETQLALVGRQGTVHGVGIDDVGLAGLQAQLDDFLPQLAGIDRFDHIARLRRFQLELGIIANGFHEGVRDIEAVMQVEGLAVEVAGRFADFEEFLDLRVMDVEIDGRRTTAQRTLGNRQGQAVHHTDEGNDARGLPDLADLLADGTDIAPIGADTAAIGGEPDIFGPGADDIVEAVADRIQEAGNRQAAIRATIGQDRRGRHEPQAGDIIIKTLGVLGIVGIGGRHAGEHVLIAFTRQEIAIFQRLLAEFGQQRIARPVDLDALDHAQVRGIALGRFGFAATGRRNRLLGRFQCRVRGCIQWRHG